jgi:signal peptidase I
VAGEPRLVKEPWLAVNLSYLLPGLGQFYARAWWTGILFLLGGQLFPVASLWQLFAAKGSLLAAGLVLLAALAVKIISLFHAHACAKRLNPPEAEQARKQAKDPYLAAFLTQILPGVGHLYLGRWVLGLVFMAFGFGLLMYVVPMVLTLKFLPRPPLPGPLYRDVALLLGSLPLLLIPVYGAGVCVVALVMGPASRRPGTGAIAALCVLIAAMGPMPIASALLTRLYVVESFMVPTATMAPTVDAGDRILAWRAGLLPLRRGDIIVFVSPVNRAQNYVKRVVALAGETVECRQDGVYVNGSRLQEGVFGRLRFTSVEGQKYAGPGEPYTVPAGTVFVLGDNNLRSFDSRFFGPVPLEDVIARAYKIYWPPSRAGPLD